MNRRRFLTATSLFLVAPARAQNSGAQDSRAQDGQGFPAFLETFRTSAREAGVSDEIFDSIVASLTLDPSLTGKRAAQSEFVRPLKNYVDEAASNGRAARGRAMVEKFAGPLHQIEHQYGVPPEMIVALWGMETDFGDARGDRDILRSLATLAFLNRDNPVYGQEFVAGLALLQKGVKRDKLRGSWAGAMGDPQFMPSAYLKYARSFSGGAAPDIWSSGPDSLASIANFLKESGWRPGLPPLVETRLPQNFDYATLRRDFSAWAQAGFASLDGGALPRAGEAMLFFPAGANGPAFLLSENFFVLKAYNFSDSYAFAGAVLAEKIAGRPVLREIWPQEAQPLTLAEREAIQRGLTQAGFYDGKIDGRFGPVTRLAIHAFQRHAGMAKADGYPSRAVLKALQGN
jgi:membrane-bound lytic murein transglycosylase B